MADRIQVTLEELAEMVRKVRAEERRRLIRAGQVDPEWQKTKAAGIAALRRVVNE